jgi:hypothetical protein
MLEDEKNMQNFGWKSLEKETSWKIKCRWEGKIKIRFKEVDHEGMK